MRIPYNQTLVQGSVLFAARGGKIHSFSLLDSSHISTWKHPDVEKVAIALKEVAEAEKKQEAPESADAAPAEGEPPAKRQRLEQAKDESPQPDAPERRGKKSKNKKKGNHDGKSRTSAVPDRPVITSLAGSDDGAHLLAVTGHDKTIWVFQHDGRGQLTQLSQRSMPKRPSAVAIGPDAQIICADKFGDVYSLPLVPGEASLSSTPARSSATPTLEAKAFKVSANTLTVHSKRNRTALVNQQMMLERKRQSQASESAKEDGPGFELTLLLGHVSMLTALVVAESEGRRYILTADRDEHVRISRYIPQAHIIEGFCLGHKDFINSLVIPAERGEILVSGGGEPDLFVWDWKAGSLLSKTSVVSLAQTISPETTKVAVSGLFTLSYPTESGNLTYVLAICEDVSAILSWQLTDENVLNRPGVIQLPGKPLHLTTLPTSADSPPKLIVAIQPGETTPTQSLHAFTLTMSDGRLSVDTDSPFKDEPLEADEMDQPEEEIRRLLFTVENLRKQPADADEAEAEMDTEIGDAPEASAP